MWSSRWAILQIGLDKSMAYCSRSAEELGERRSKEGKKNGREGMLCLSIAAIFEAVALELEPHGFRRDPMTTPEGVVATLIARTLATLPTDDRVWLRENVDTGNKEDLKDIVNNAE